ncbi:hypothetical protein JVT61DRAFT_10556 [Boletus reticuloceps]|uniref:ADP-ribosylation factor n=1 Tax=Boletus reticuloceps TaxID=495285 RepID=A0A8I2YZG3_9AGAM|nr:hypothetical protein JVT61DRAFT_10556 [Boletus reticuloceps]
MRVNTLKRTRGKTNSIERMRRSHPAHPVAPEGEDGMDGAFIKRQKLDPFGMSDEDPLSRSSSLQLDKPLVFRRRRNTQWVSRSRIYSPLCSKTRRCVGLDAAGKTTILYKLKLGEIVTMIPTVEHAGY